MTASRDNTVRRWRATGEPIGIHVGHTEPVTRAIFGQDDQTVVTCSEDGSVCVWSADALIASLSVDAPIVVAAVSRELIVAGDVLGGVHFLELVSQD